MKADGFQVNDITVDLIDDPENYLTLEEVFIGFTTQNLLKKLFNGGEIDKLQYNNVLEAGRALYKESLRYVVKKIDMIDTLWKHAVWVDFFSRETAKWTDIEYFISRFEGIIQFDNQEIDMLYEEFVDYKTLSINDLLEDVLTDAVTQENKNLDEYRIYIIWYYLYQMKSPAASNCRFQYLFNVARLVLVTLHTNAGIERVYALVNKNKAEGTDRYRFDIEGSLSSILAVKLDRPEAFFKCYDFKPDAKKATRKYNT